MTDPVRTRVGFWIESPFGAQWANQGMTRLVGFLIEGAALGKRYCFCVCVPDHIREQAEQDLATLNAVAGRDYTLHSPRDVNMAASDFATLARFANQHVNVEAWISIFPNQLHAQHLDAPVAVVFPDAIGLAYHDFNEALWELEGPMVAWRNKVGALLETKASNIITFSSHVARDQIMRFFNVSADRIQVIPHAPPSLSSALSFVKNGRRSAESRFRAASMLRRHAAQRGLHYLADFPFEHVRFAAISTQDRVTKNLRVAVDAIERLLRLRNEDWKLIMTAQIHFGSSWTPLPSMIEWTQLIFDALSMPDLPREVHAAFYHCADVVIHPAVFEGGRGVFPYYEAISVGTPCVMAIGPHVAEFLEEAPEMSEFTFDPHDADELADLIVRVSRDRDSVVRVQEAVFQRLSKRPWSMVAAEYAKAALESPRKLSAKTLASKVASTMNETSL